MDLSLKRCGQCGEYFPHSDFNKNKTKYDGLDSFCRRCRSEYNRKYRKANSKAISEYNKQYNKEHKSSYIYFIYNGSKTPVYVGSCSNICRRISAHINLHSNISEHMSENWEYISYIKVDSLVESYEERIYLEHTIIEEICPIWNNKVNIPKIHGNRAEKLSEYAMNILYNLDNLDIYKVNDSFIDYDAIDIYLINQDYF